MLSKEGREFNDEDYVENMAKEHAEDNGTIRSALISEGNSAREGAGVAVSFTRYRGYLASPGTSQSESLTIPCLIVIHEWWGLNDQIEAITRQLAGEGYHALAVDLYGKPATADVKTARKYMKECFKVKEEYVMDCLKEALEYLQAKFVATDGSSFPTKIGVIGWCLGGMFSLQLALTVPQSIAACVIYYGKVETEVESLQTLQAPILGIFGGADQGIPVDSLRAFEASLDALHKRHEIHIYPGAEHAFCNPTGNRYQPEPAQDAWGKTLNFLQRYVKH